MTVERVGSSQPQIRPTTVEDAAPANETTTESVAESTPETTTDQYELRTEPSGTPLVAPALAADTTRTDGWDTEHFAYDGNVIRFSRGGLPEAAGPAGLDPGPVEGAEPTVSPERQAEIQQYVSGLRTTTPVEEAFRIDEALQGRSSLGALAEEEQRFLVDSALDRWVPSSPGQPTNYAAIQELGLLAGDRGTTSAVVADAYADRANVLSARAPLGPAGVDQRNQAATLAVGAVDALRTPGERQAFLERLGPSDAARFASALTAGSDRPAGIQAGISGDPADPDRRIGATNALLQASAQAQPTSATNAFVDAAFRGLPDDAYRTGGFLSSAASGNTQRSMAEALANQRFANDPSAREREARRIEGILRSDQGRDYLTSDRLTVEQRVQNLEMLRSNPGWDRAFFERTGDVWSNRELAEAHARPRTEAFATLRGDTPQVLSGSDLENTIGASMSLPPAGIPEDETPEQRAAREEAVARGEHNLFASGPQGQLVQPIADAIRNAGGDPPEVTVLPIQFASNETGPVSMNLYRVRDPSSGTDRFVDQQGRTYDSLEHWKSTNKLPAGTVTYPAGGHLGPDGALETASTPRSSLGARVSERLDDVALAGGLLAGGAMILGTGGVAAPVVFAAASAWGAVRSVEELNDRATHGLSIGLEDPNARRAWLGLAGNTLGFGGATLGLASRGFAALGNTAQARNAAFVASALNGGAFVADTAMAANTGHQLLTNWDQLSSSERASMALSIGFWGVGAGANARMFAGSARVNAALAEGLPQRGPNAFQPPDGFNPALSRTPDGAFVDAQGVRWRPDPTRSGHWEVGDARVPVRPDGTVAPPPGPEIRAVVDNHLYTPPRIQNRNARDPIREGHDETALKAFLAGDPANGVPAQGVIEAQAPIPSLPGASVVTYRLYQGRPGGGVSTVPQARTGTKTVFDPNVWTPERLARHIDDVVRSNPPPAGYDGFWQVSYGGVTYGTHYDHGVLRTFYVIP